MLEKLDFAVLIRLLDEAMIFPVAIIGLFITCKKNFKSKPFIILAESGACNEFAVPIFAS